MEVEYYSKIKAYLIHRREDRQLALRGGGDKILFKKEKHKILLSPTVHSKYFILKIIPKIQIIEEALAHRLYRVGQEIFYNKMDSNKSIKTFLAHPV